MSAFAIQILQQTPYTNSYQANRAPTLRFILFLRPLLCLLMNLSPFAIRK